MSSRNYKAMGEAKLRGCYENLMDQPPEDRDVIVSLCKQRGLVIEGSQVTAVQYAVPIGVEKPKQTAKVKPMLAFDLSQRVQADGTPRIVTVPEPAEEWVIEPKYDGIRLMVHKTMTGLRVYGGRNGAEHTGNQPAIEAVLQKLPNDTLLDGELVRGAGKHLDLSGGEQLYVVFDMLRVGGVDLTGEPFSKRRSLLEGMNGLDFFEGPNVQLTPQMPCDQDVYEQLVEAGWEGGMAKKLNGLYRPGKRSRDLLKLKPQWTDEAEVLGYEMGKGESNQTKVGALKVRMLETGAETSVGFECEPDQVYEFVGKICEVAHFGVFEATGKPRHPGFVRWRPDRDPA